MNIQILVADDDPDIAQVLCDRLEGMGHTVRTASDGQAALAILEQPPLFQLVFLDLEMPKLSGIDALKCMKSQWPELPVIILTGHGTITSAVEAMQIGAADFLTKPFDGQQLNAVITKALQRKKLDDEVSRLLGGISHDVKNLLMPVVLGADLLDSEISDLFNKLPEVEAVKMEESHRTCDQVLGLLRETAKCLQERTKSIADYVKTQSAPVRFVPCDISHIMNSVLKTLELLAKEKAITVNLDGLNSLPTIMADEVRLHSLFYNLIHNAIAAVPVDGSISVQGRSHPETQHIVLTVQDTGAGMSAEMCATLFTAGAVSRKVGGTGLGTKIVKDTVDVHNGTISVKSTEGIGTTFSISLPLHPHARAS